MNAAQIIALIIVFGATIVLALIVWVHIENRSTREFEKEWVRSRQELDEEWDRWNQEFDKEWDRSCEYRPRRVLRQDEDERSAAKIQELEKAREQDDERRRQFDERRGQFEMSVKPEDQRSAIEFLKEMKRAEKQTAKRCRKLKKEKKALEISSDQMPIFIAVDGELSWEEQYQHPNWQRMRLFILNRDDWRCRRCGDQNNRLDVHHNAYSSGFIWEIDPTFLETICVHCHSSEHGRDLQS